MITMGTCTVCGKPATGLFDPYIAVAATMRTSIEWQPRCADHGGVMPSVELRSQADIDRIAALEAENAALLDERDKYRAEVHRQVSAKLADNSNADMYQHNAARTFPAMPQQDALDMTALGIAGEAGEIVDAWKKVRWQGHAHDVGKEIDELGDLLWYLAIRSHTLGVKLSVVMARNIAKLQARYPDGFDSERSQQRAKESGAD